MVRRINSEPAIFCDVHRSKLLLCVCNLDVDASKWQSVAGAELAALAFTYLIARLFAKSRATIVSM
jgi:hypothetical protein